MANINYSNISSQAEPDSLINICPPVSMETYRAARKITVGRHEDRVARCPALAEQSLTKLFVHLWEDEVIMDEGTKS